MTFKTDIEQAADGEAIEAIVIGDGGWGDYNMEKWGQTKAVRGKVISWAKAAPLLDRDYYSGYGAPDCPAIYAWTATKVIFVSQYDGSTSVESVARNPEPCNPIMPGG